MRTSRKTFFITTVFFAFLIGGIAVAGVWMYRRVSAAAADLAGLDIQIASAAKEQAQTGPLLALLKNHEADFNRLRSFRVSRRNPVEFLTYFEALAAQTHTAIDINLGNNEITGDAMKFQFTINGDERNATALLALVERAPYELTIDGISIQRSADEKNPSSVHLLINLHIQTAP